MEVDLKGRHSTGAGMVLCTSVPQLSLKDQNKTYNPNSVSAEALGLGDIALAGHFLMQA